MNGAGVSTSSALVAGVVLLFLQAFWGLAYNSLTQDTQRVERQLTTRMERIEKEEIKVREFEEFKTRIDKVMDDLSERLKDVAPRAESDARLTTNASALAAVRVELDNLKRDLGSAYSIKDAILETGRRLERLETWSRVPPGVPASPLSPSTLPPTLRLEQVPPR